MSVADAQSHPRLPGGKIKKWRIPVSFEAIDNGNQQRHRPSLYVMQGCSVNMPLSSRKHDRIDLRIMFLFLILFIKWLFLCQPYSQRKTFIGRLFQTTTTAPDKPERSFVIPMRSHDRQGRRPQRQYPKEGPEFLQSVDAHGSFDHGQNHFERRHRVESIVPFYFFIRIRPFPWGHPRRSVVWWRC